MPVLKFICLKGVHGRFQKVLLMLLVYVCVLYAGLGVKKTFDYCLCNS